VVRRDLTWPQSSVATADTSAATQLRVVVGEDDLLMREGMVRLLAESGLEVVAQAADAEDLVRKVVAHRPDVAIVDVQMPPNFEADGLLAAIDIRSRFPEIGVLILSAYLETSHALELIGNRPGGVGYLLKERIGDVGAFVAAVRRVSSGGSVLDPGVVRRIISGSSGKGGPLDLLTPRELAVLAVMAKGKSNIGVARELDVTETAVEKHITSIFRKLRFGAKRNNHRRVQAVLAYTEAQANPQPGPAEQH
jgi:DNA-binding NarL/FixJ family response regulator